MKYKDRFTWDDPEFSIGRFYNSDIRKLVALGLRHKYMLPDCDEEPRKIHTERVRNPNIVYYSIRKRNKVIAYAAADYLGESCWLSHHWKKQKEKLEAGDWYSYGKLRVAFMFEYLKARKIYTNIPVIMTKYLEMAKAMGYKEEGVSREAVFYDGEPHDVVLLAILRREWI